jgi:TonB family protein
MTPRTTREAALLIGCLFVFLAFMWVIFRGGDKSMRAQGSKNDSIGQVVTLVGEADQRAPGQMSFESLAAGASLVAGELIAVHEVSQVTLKFIGGASLRLQPGARLVTERDSTRAAGAVLATLLDGDADVLAIGTPASFRLIKNGHDITLIGSTNLDAPDSIVVSTGARVFPGPAQARSKPANNGALVTATTPIETSAPSSIPTSRMGDEGGEQASADSLSNDEIRKALRSESGFFSRCYLTYLNRVKPAERSPKSTTITVGFVISNSGKIRDAKVVRSDFNDAVLNNCVLETVERTPFRAFKGSDIPVLEFPIELK